MKKARSSITGQFVKMSVAKEDPEHHVIEEHPSYEEQQEAKRDR